MPILRWNRPLEGIVCEVIRRDVVWIKNYLFIIQQTDKSILPFPPPQKQKQNIIPSKMGCQQSISRPPMFVHGGKNRSSVSAIVCPGIIRSKRSSRDIFYLLIILGISSRRAYPNGDRGNWVWLNGNYSLRAELRGNASINSVCSEINWFCVTTCD